MTAQVHATTGPPALLARAMWQEAEGGWALKLQGPWRRTTAPVPPLPASLQGGARVGFDATQLENWDIGLAAALWQLQGQLLARGVDVQAQGLPEGLRAVLQIAAPALASAAVGVADSASPFALAHRACSDQHQPLVVRQVTRPTAPASAPAAAAAAAVVTITFFGEVLLALVRLLRGRSKLRAADVLEQMDQTGPRSLPIVLLTCALLGLMLAYMGGAQLARIGAAGFLADVVTVGMVRELAGLMTGIILAGRVGAAFAAQLATMKAGEEIDALRVLGVDPIAHLVLPRLLALLLMAPALVACGAVAGVLAGLPAALFVYGVSAAEYLHQCLRALSFTHLWIGLFKGLLYVALVALAGCREGLNAGRDAQAVGAATTAAVVKALVWIVAAASLTTVVFTVLGF